MNDLYKAEEDCMAFSIETLEKYFFDKVKSVSGVELNYSFCARLNFPGDVIGKLDCVSFDGQKYDFDIHFFNSAMTSIFILDEQFVFIDDAQKKDIRGVEGCIIYEGYLRDKTHKQIIELFLKLFNILHGTVNIDYEEQLVSKIGYYRVNNYTVKLTKPNCERQVIQFENILFLIN